MIAGADGYKKRWVVAVGHDDGTTRVELAESFSDLVRHPELEQIVIDVPIGLPDAGARQADRLARRMIGPRRNSVFPGPIRPMLGASTYEEACARRYGVEGKRCSKQLFAILPLIAIVDAHMSPGLQECIREGHPEVSFTALAGHPMPTYKGKPEGRDQRLAVLRAVFPDLDDAVARFNHPGALTDILDAYALLWTARRVVAGRSETLPPDPERDRRNLHMEIVY